MEAKQVTWFKVDDGLHSHTKAIEAESAAMGLWVMAGSWCANQLTDGFVPAYMGPRLGATYTCVHCGGSEDGAARLVSVGLWKPATRGSKTGWEFHDWADMQPSRQQVREDRAAQAKRQREYRERKAAARDAVRNGTRSTSRDGARDVSRDGATHAVTASATNAAPTRPDPTTTRSVVVGGESAREDQQPARSEPRMPAQKPISRMEEQPTERAPGTMTRDEAIAYARARLPAGSPEKLTGAGVGYAERQARRRVGTRPTHTESEAPDVDRTDTPD